MMRQILRVSDPSRFIKSGVCLFQFQHSVSENNDEKADPYAFFVVLGFALPKKQKLRYRGNSTKTP